MLYVYAAAVDKLDRRKIGVAKKFLNFHKLLNTIELDSRSSHLHHQVIIIFIFSGNRTLKKIIKSCILFFRTNQRNGPFVSHDQSNVNGLNIRLLDKKTDSSRVLDRKK